MYPSITSVEFLLAFVSTLHNDAIVLLPILSYAYVYKSDYNDGRIFWNIFSKLYKFSNIILLNIKLLNIYIQKRLFQFKEISFNRNFFKKQSFLWMYIAANLMFLTQYVLYNYRNIFFNYKKQ